MVARILALMLIFAGVLRAQETERIWEGTWKNRKFNTTGPLKCTASTEDGKTWKATFDGKFMGEDFSYETEFSAKKARKQLNLSGKATLDGDRYEWAGHMKDDQLFGKFRSLKGYFGEFILTEKDE